MRGGVCLSGCCSGRRQQGQSWGNIKEYMRLGDQQESVYMHVFMGIHCICVCACVQESRDARTNVFWCV